MESPGGVAGPPGFSSPAQRMQLGHEDLVWTVMTSRFWLPAWQKLPCEPSELAWYRQHTEVVCNILLLDNTVQAFKVKGTVKISSSTLVGGRWWRRRTCAHLLLWELQNYNSLLNSHPQENVGFHQKKIPHIQGQRSPSKTVGGAKTHLESNPIPARDTWRAQTNLVRTKTQRPHRDWIRAVFGCLLRRYGSAVACRRGRCSGCSSPGCGLSPAGGGCLVCTRTQEKGAVTPQETEPDLAVSVQETPAEAWVGSGLLQGPGHWVQQCLHRTFWRKTYLIFITSTIAWPQVKQQVGNTAPPINRKLD